MAAVHGAVERLLSNTWQPREKKGYPGAVARVEVLQGSWVPPASPGSFVLCVAFRLRCVSLLAAMSSRLDPVFMSNI